MTFMLLILGRPPCRMEDRIVDACLHGNASTVLKLGS